MAYKFNDSTLSYYTSQLENLDPKFHEPLFMNTWSRDISLRPGLTFGDQLSSYIRGSFAGAGTLQSKDNAIPFISSRTTAIPVVSINGEKIGNPLHLCAREVSYTSVELDRSMKMGQSIDTMQVNALNNMYQLNMDEMAYVGNTTVGAYGLLNSPLVTASNAPNGAGGTSTWVSKTAAEILADVNNLLAGAWESSAYTRVPFKLGLPPAQYNILSNLIVSTAGNMSVLSYLMQNSIANTQNGRPLEIVAMRRLKGIGVNGTDRAIAYSQEADFVRFPAVPIRRENSYFHSLFYTTPYIWAMGSVEFVYPETVRYLDGI